MFKKKNAVLLPSNVRFSDMEIHDDGYAKWLQHWMQYPGLNQDQQSVDEFSNNDRFISLELVLVGLCRLLRKKGNRFDISVNIDELIEKGPASRYEEKALEWLTRKGYLQQVEWTVFTTDKLTSLFKKTLAS
jgi:hypothetical protein